MKDDNSAMIRSRWGRLSTGLKMLLILSFGLLPLGLVAVLASVTAARENRAAGELKARAVLSSAGQRLTSHFGRQTVAVREAQAVFARAPNPASACPLVLDALSYRSGIPMRVAFYGPDRRLFCATNGFAPEPSLLDEPGAGFEVENDVLRMRMRGPDGAVAQVEVDRDALAQVTKDGAADDYDLELAQGLRTMVLFDGYQQGRFSREVALEQPALAGNAELRVRTAAVPLTFADLVMILLPVMMWVGAALIGWLIVERLILSPLGRLQKVISAYKPGDRPIVLPVIKSPAKEISALGTSFDQVTQTVARHEAELEAAVDRQTRLVREVHHRVKNNLQVVASLLNLHSRGVANEDVAAAYASIQRRVDALAVVHRNHYAELEDNVGVALKSLISELCANLRGSAPKQAAGMQIRLDVASLHAGQDVAVSTAFFITEIVEFAMLCGARQVLVMLEAEEPGFGRLSLQSDSLAGEIHCDPELFTRFERIVTGLARQLRSTLERDETVGRFSVRIQTVGKVG